MEANVVRWLEYAAQKWSDKTAICDEYSSISYKDYHDMSVGIADAICKKKYDKRVPVVVYMPKSLKVLVAFMGIAYSGNFYTPLDVDMPKERIKIILNTLKPSAMITTKEYIDEVRSLEFDGDVFIYEDIDKNCFSEIVLKAAESIIENDLLYVLFTSGSTGVPKGVCVTHGGVANFTEWVTKEFNITEDDIMGNQTPFYFDMSILDIYGALKSGSTLNIIPRKLFPQPVPLLEYIKNNKINVLSWVPSAMLGIARFNAFKNIDVSNDLRLVMFAGEPMPVKQLAIWMSNCPNTTFANLYGPTECTNICTFHTIKKSLDSNKPIPIGKAIRNTRAYVLDKDDNLVVTPYEKGELCISGKGVSLGYYNDIEKTKNVFVQNPINNKYEDRIFRTGDIVYYDDEMNLVYACRKDFQIKHRGYRIELGEIEHAILSIDGISICVCLYNYERKQIVAFINTNLSKGLLNEKLMGRIPDYMLVDKVINLETFPVNANGKIDKLKLQEEMK